MHQLPTNRRKHIVPKQDLSSIMQYQIHVNNANQRPMWEVCQQALLVSTCCLSKMTDQAPTTEQIEAAEVEFGEKIGEGKRRRLVGFLFTAA